MLIELDRISRIYRTDEVETTALAEIDLTIDRGEFVAIIGPSGCGKSSLLNVLGTIDRPTSGSYRFGGTEIAKFSEAALASYRAAHLGFIFQNFNLIDDLTIQQNVELGLLYRGGASNAKTAVAEALERVGVDHRARHYPHQLSGGQQQRVAIARAIVGRPDLILADEPTGNLDSGNGAQVMGILRRLHAEGATLVMVTHSHEQATMAQRVVEMKDGRVVS